jgi:hypothetical protein
MSKAPAEKEKTGHHVKQVMGMLAFRCHYKRHDL